MKLSELLDKLQRIKFETEEKGDIDSEEVVTFPNGTVAYISHEGYTTTAEQDYACEWPDGTNFLRELIKRGTISDPEITE